MSSWRILVYQHKLRQPWAKKKIFFGEDKKRITETPIRTFTALQKPVPPTAKGNPNDKIMYYIGL